MKQQLLFLLLTFSYLVQAAPHIIYVQTPANTTLYCYETETPQVVFWKCRQQQLCSCPPNSLTLMFGPYAIKEGSESAYAKRLMDFIEVFTQEAFIKQPAPIQTPPTFYNPQYNNYVEYVVIKAPNGEFLYFSPNNTFEQVFQYCRSNNYCWNNQIFEIAYNNYIIKENNLEAQYTFAQYGQRVHQTTYNPALLIQQQPQPTPSFWTVLLNELLGTN